MTTTPTRRRWRRNLTLSAIAGLFSGTARAIAAWLIDHFTSGS